MSFRTETALKFAPGVVLDELDVGGMIIDRNSGEYLPADQVFKDPLNPWQLDYLDNGHRGYLELGPHDDETACAEGDEPEDE